MLNSAITQSSPQSAFASINQIQLMMLIILYGATLDIKILNYIKSMVVSLFKFNLLSLPIFDFINGIESKLDYEQKNEELNFIGLESGSTLINLFDTLMTLILFALFHLLLSLCYIKHRSDLNRSSCTRAIKNLFTVFTFGVYIRLFMETNMIILLSSISELIEHTKNSSDRKRPLIVPTSFILICAIVLVL